MQRKLSGVKRTKQWPVSLITDPEDKALIFKRRVNNARGMD
jgi:hypothetical protein